MKIKGCKVQRDTKRYKEDRHIVDLQFQLQSSCSIKLWACNRILQHQDGLCSCFHHRGHIVHNAAALHCHWSFCVLRLQILADWCYDQVWRGKPRDLESLRLTRNRFWDMHTHLFCDRQSFAWDLVTWSGMRLVKIYNANNMWNGTAEQNCVQEQHWQASLKARIIRICCYALGTTPRARLQNQPLGPGWWSTQHISRMRNKFWPCSPLLSRVKNKNICENLRKPPRVIMHHLFFQQLCVCVWYGMVWYGMVW